MTPSQDNFIAAFPRFTPAGLTGLADYAEDVNRLGDLQALWSLIWSEVFGKPVIVPPVPLITPTTSAALKKFGLRVVFLPNIPEKDHPEGFVKPAWGKYLDVSAIKKRGLPGRWVAIETIRKPDWNDPAGYGQGDADPLARALDLESRFDQSWDVIHKIHLKKVAGLIGVTRKSVRLPGVRERNLFGNVLNHLRMEKGEDNPDLGSGNSWEWCEDAYGSQSRLFAGCAKDGGLADVHCSYSHYGYAHIAFRVLVVL